MKKPFPKRLGIARLHIATATCRSEWSVSAMKNPLSLALMYEILRFTQNDSVAKCPIGRDMF